jgi:ATP/maltotriose-dependent transcriptional regulator MalT/DNA-binding SARP family transcriptional activator
MLLRTRILARLAEGRQGRLSTVIAGPGWGKTTALTQYVHDLAMPVAWCQLSGADANITAFTTRLCEVIASEFPGFGADLALDLAGIPAPNENWIVIARALSTEVTETVAVECILVLDDYHFVDADESVNRLLATMLELLPSHVHTVVASRRELPATLARASASACHITEDDLRFAEAEGTAYLRLGLRDPMPLDLLSGFVRDLEGWPLGLTLMAEHLRANKGITQLPAALPGLFDYLSEEILCREPSDIQELLVVASVPERFGPRLLGQVLGRAVATAVDELARRHLFVTRLDDTGEWYRFHHLFRAYLLWRLERMASTEERQIWNLRVAEAWHACGSPHQAVRHELLAADFDRAAQTLVNLAPALIAAGQWLTLRSWLEELPPATQEGYPSLLVYLATCHFIDRRLEDCRWQAGRALTACEQQGDEATAAHAIELLIRSYAGEDTHADHLRAVAAFERHRTAFSYDHAAFARGAAEAACALAELNRFAEAGEVFAWALAHPAGQMEDYSAVSCFCGFYYHLPLGEHDTALAYLQTAYRSGHARDQRNFLPFYTAYLANARFHTGGYDDARLLALEMVEMASARGMERTFHASMAALLGLIALFAGDVDDARAQSLRFEEWRQKASVWGQAWGDVLQAGLAVAGGDTREYLAWTERAIVAARAQGSEYRLALVLIELARLKLHRATPDQPVPSVTMNLLLQALAAADRIAARYCQARANMLLAVALSGSAARDHLAQALRLSQEHGYDSLWLQHERALAHPLLMRAATWRLYPKYVAQLSGLLRPSTGPHALTSLSVVTLGRFAVSVGGAEIDHVRWGRPKVMLLFKYLLSAPDFRAHRDVLLEALWPELPPASARSNLNNAVYRLRRALEPAIDTRQPSRFLTIASQHYCLVLGPEDRWDVDFFRRRAAVARQTQRDEDFRNALESYGGDYLPDDPYDDWATELRERLREEYGRLLSMWGETLAAEGALARAIDVTARLLALDPTRESTHRTLMTYYSSSGQRDHALRQYRRCETVLRRAIGVAPDPETAALYRRILHA